MLWQSSKYAYIILGTTFLVKKKHLLAQFSDLVEKISNWISAPSPQSRIKWSLLNWQSWKEELKLALSSPLAFLTSELPYKLCFHSSHILFWIISFFTLMMLVCLILCLKKIKTNASLRFPRFDSTNGFVSNNQKLLLIRRQFNCELWLWSQAPGSRFSQITCKSFASGTC